MVLNLNSYFCLQQLSPSKLYSEAKNSYSNNDTKKSNENNINGMDSMSWMTFDFKVENQAQSIDNAVQYKLFCCNFGGD